MSGDQTVGRKDEDRYFLPADYVPNDVNLTVDAVSGAEYWDDERVALSARYQRRAYAVASEIASKREVRRVVDVGCGVATKLAACFDSKRFELIGIDQRPAVEACERLGRPGRYYADDFEQPSTAVLGEIAPADMVISSDVIEHLLDPDPLVAYLRAIVSTSGIVIITTPDRGALCGVGATHPSNPAHIREWSRPEFVRYLESRGFAVERSELLPPFSYQADRMTARWLVKRALSRLPHRTCHMVTCRRA